MRGADFARLMIRATKRLGFRLAEGIEVELNGGAEKRRPIFLLIIL
jgi:hypothetical protein